MGCSSCFPTSDFIKIKEIRSNFFHKYIIRNVETKEEYAYKMININTDSKKKKKILNDAQILKNINHPNIILLKSVYYSKDKRFLNIITEYADDGNLQQKFDEKKEKKEYFEERTLLNWFMQICLALKYIHNKSILHRNIKPSNIFLMKKGSDNIAKLGDFGIAKNLGPLNYTRTRIETHQYSAPEMLEEKDYNFKVDIWSLGATFYQLIILDYPFEGKTNEEKQENIKKGNKKEIPKECKIDREFIDIVNQMLSLRPDERPTAEDILKKAIIKNRIQGYLKGNKFDLKNSKSIIEKYENENKDSNEEIRINVFEEIDDDILDLEKIKENIEKKNNKAMYDYHKQMILMSTELTRRSNSLPIQE